MRNRPLLTGAAVLSLALGIGANTAMFSIADSLLLQTLPVSDPDELVLVSAGDSPNWSHPVWEEIHNRSQLFEGVFAWQPDRLNLSAGGQTDFVEGIYASGQFFDVLGVPAVLGRTFGEGDDRRGGGIGGPVAVVSYGFWQRRYGGAGDVLGQTLTIEGVPFTIIGVTPSSFFGLDVGRKFDVIVPLETEPLIRGRGSIVEHAFGTWLGIMARLKPGQTLEAATSALQGVQPHIRDATVPHLFDEQRRESYMRQPWTLEPAASGRSSLRSRFQQPVSILLVVVAIVLLIACANVANLLLARTATRRHELSVRKALGASRFRLARQCLIESLLLSGTGAALGLVVARWGSDILVHQLSTVTTAVFLDVSLDARTLGFSAIVGLGTATLFGTVPAVRTAQTQAAEAFKDVGRSHSLTRRTRIHSILVVAQVALSLVLVIAAGLFVRTFAGLATLDTGFDKNRVLVVDVDAKNSRSEPTQRLDLGDRIRLAVQTIPGVETASLGMKTPVSPGGVWVLNVTVTDGPSIPERERYVHANYITPDWFATYGTNMLAGRDFDDLDGRDSPVVAIVNRTFSQRFLGGSDPVGRYLLSDEYDSPLEIVGVVDDVIYRSLRASATPMVYLPLADGTKHSFQHDPPYPISVSVRASAGTPTRLASSVVSTIGRIDPTFALTVRPITDDVDARLVQERLLAIISAFFGVLALLLAGLGLFGVTSYAVAQRRAEIGIRMALGAAPARVVRMVCRHVALLVGVGAVFGGALSLWVTRFAGALLFRLEPRDPVTFICSAALIAAVGMVAAWLPARRASQIDPKTALGGP
ncbi:MAG: ABC transporter permease [Gemmatimonadota bacterium]|nr:MAG: ABC transporter permease [Gemmatimonadota bacterium]